MNTRGWELEHILKKKVKGLSWTFPCEQTFSVPSSVQFSSVQSLSHVWLFVIPWTVARQAPLSFTISQSLLILMSIKSVMPSKHLKKIVMTFSDTRSSCSSGLSFISWPLFSNEFLTLYSLIVYSFFNLFFLKGLYLKWPQLSRVPNLPLYFLYSTVSL